MFDGWKFLHTNDHGDTIDESGRIVNEDGTEPHGESTVTKESVYDEKIAPLMAEIIKVCKESGIAMFSTFALPKDNDPSLACTTIVPDGYGYTPVTHEMLYKIVMSNQVTYGVLDT